MYAGARRSWTQPTVRTMQTGRPGSCRLTVAPDDTACVIATDLETVRPPDAQAVSNYGQFSNTGNGIGAANGWFMTEVSASGGRWFIWR